MFEPQQQPKTINQKPKLSSGFLFFEVQASKGMFEPQQQPETINQKP
jgi:hypothetical protein